MIKTIAKITYSDPPVPEFVRYEFNLDVRENG